MHHWHGNNTVKFRAFAKLQVLVRMRNPCYVSKHWCSGVDVPVSGGMVCEIGVRHVKQCLVRAEQRLHAIWCPHGMNVTANSLLHSWHCRTPWRLHSQQHSNRDVLTWGSSHQWHNDGVAAASRDGGHNGKGPPKVPEFLMINFNVCVCCYRVIGLNAKT